MHRCLLNIFCQSLGKISLRQTINNPIVFYNIIDTQFSPEPKFLEVMKKYRPPHALIIKFMKYYLF